MGKFSEAADVLKRRAKEAQAMIDAAAALDELGNIENVAQEAQRGKQEAITAKAAALADLATAKEDVKKAKDQAKEIVAKATDQALIKLGEADQKAQAILDGAAAQANGMVLRAAAEANEQLSGVAGKVGQLTAEKTKLEDTINVLNSAVLKLQADGEEAEKKLMKIQAAIAKYAGV